MTDDFRQVSELLQQAAGWRSGGVPRPCSLITATGSSGWCTCGSAAGWRGGSDDSDVLQEAFIEVARKLPEYAREPKLPLFLWLRHLTRAEAGGGPPPPPGTQLRDADREVTLHRGGLPMADSVSLAASAPGHAHHAVAGGHQGRDPPASCRRRSTAWTPIDREVLALKHFEQLSTTEIAEVLGLSKAGSGSRYLRAIKRLREILSQIPGLRGVLNPTPRPAGSSTMGGNR